MIEQTRRKVSAADMARNFGHWRDVGGREPVFITNHGRVTHVLLSVDQFEALERDAPLAPGIVGDEMRSLYELAGWMDQGVILCDEQLRIKFANRVSDALCARTISLAPGEDLWSALPEFKGTLAEMHIRRAALGGEPGAVDIPSPFRADAWLHVQSFPIGDHVALLMQDITESMQAHRATDIKSALIDALHYHGDMGYVRVSRRGFVERATEAVSTLIGLPPNRIENVAIWDFIATRDRTAFKEQLESVLKGDGPRRIRAEFLTNEGSRATTDIVAMPVQGAYGADGAVLLFNCAANQDAGPS